MIASPVARALAPLLVASAAAGCGAQPGAGPGPRPGGLLIAIDGLRADHLGAYGYDRDTSPTLSALAAEGVRFEEVFASAPQLIPAHVALLTGCEPTLARRFLLPEQEGPSERRWHVSERGAHLAVQFLAAGYATAAFVDHAHLDQGQGLSRGFQRYEFLDEASAQHWEGGQTTRIVEHFLQWLRALPEGRPWFAYLHMNQLERCWSDPLAYSQGTFQPRPELAHVPPVGSTDSVFFAVPRTRWRGGPRSLGQYEAVYDDAIHALDAELGRLCASLRRSGRFDSTSIHVLGAFGVQFGEAGLYLRAGRYSQADLGVPWIFRPRSGLTTPRGRGVPGLASTLDVAPTLLALEGLSVPPTMTGLSQAAVTRAADARAAARDFAYASCGLQGGCALIGSGHVLECLVPEGASDMGLRRSWMGERAEPERRLGFNYYERERLRAPPLDAELPPRPELEFSRFRDEVSRWLTETNDERHYLQAPAGRSSLGEAVLARLRARGYVEASE